MSFTLEGIMKLPAFSEAYLLSNKLDLNKRNIDGVTVLDNDIIPSKDYEKKIALTSFEVLIKFLDNQVVSGIVNTHQLPVLCLRCTDDNLLLLKMKYYKIINESVIIIILPQHIDISNVITSITYEIIRTSNYNTKATYEENYFQEIIFNCNINDYKCYVEKANMLGLRLDEHIGLILIEPNDLRLSKDMTEYLKNINLRKSYILSKNNITLIIVQTCVVNNIDYFLTKHANEILNMLLQEFSNVSFNIGIGNCYNDISYLRKSFYEARVALTMSIVYGKVNKVLKFNELGIYSIMFDYGNKESLYGFYFNYLGHIQEFDKKNNTEYFYTIISLIDNYFSINKTSKDLHIHYNTVLNKINSIKELFQLDLYNQDTKVNVCVANTIYKFLNKDNNIFE